jgi:hypothetical protein
MVVLSNSSQARKRFNRIPVMEVPTGEVEETVERLKG